MNENIPFSKLLNSSTLIMLGCYIVFLRVTNTLVLYIRPEYQLFTLVMATILLLVGISTFLAHLRTILFHNVTLTFTYKDFLHILLLILLIPFGIGSSRHILSSQVALLQNNNLVNVAGIVNTQHTAPIKSGLSRTTVDTSSYTLADWVRLYQLNPNPEYFNHKSVSVIGFVEPQPNNTFLLTRYLIRCCIADAIPISLLVDQKPGGFSADDWIQVTGQFIVKKVNGEEQIVIQPSRMKKIARPDNPYF